MPRRQPDEPAPHYVDVAEARRRGHLLQASIRALEFTTVDLTPGAANAFKAALASDQAALRGETLWYRMVAGGPVPRYVRLRPRLSLLTVLDGSVEQTLPERANSLVARMTVEILTLRPAMSYGLSPSRD